METVQKTIQILEVKDTMTALKNSIKSSTTDLTKQKKKISELEDKSVETIPSEEQNKKMKKKVKKAYVNYTILLKETIYALL